MLDQSSTYRYTKILKRVSQVSTVTFLSRILGFVRDMVFASMFAASPAFDAFIIAFKIPNMMRRLFAEGAFSQAFVPVLTSYQHSQSVENNHIFINKMLGTLLFSLCLISIPVMLFPKFIIYLFAPGFFADAGRANLAVNILRYTFPYLSMISVIGFLTAILNTHNRFILPAASPIILSIGLVVGALLWSPHLPAPVMALAWIVPVVGVLQIIFILSQYIAINPMPVPQVDWRDPGVRRVLKLMMGALIGVSVSQVGLVIDGILASFLPAGSISWLYYSERLAYLPVGVFGVAVATVALPDLSRAYSANNSAAYADSVIRNIKLVLLLSMPACIGLLSLAKPIILVLFYYGKFSLYDLSMSYNSLLALAIGIPAFMLVKILASCYYARQTVKIPVYCACISLLVNVVLSIILMQIFAHAGLALAVSLAAYVNIFLLFIKFEWFDSGHDFQKVWQHFIAKISLASVIMGLACYICNPGINVWLSYGKIYQFIILSGLILLGASTYSIILYLLGFKSMYALSATGK